MDHMTAKVSCFARAYHEKNNSAWVFRDPFARRLLGEAAYEAVAENMSSGIQFFCPGFEGTRQEALRWIVDHQLAPSVLGRSAFCESHLENEIRLGAEQYVMFAAGLDTYAYRTRHDQLRIFELDLPQMIQEKLRQEQEVGLVASEQRKCIACNFSNRDWAESLKQHGFCKEKKSFGSLLGISYYLSKAEFYQLLQQLSEMFSVGSAICFDYPTTTESEQTHKNEELAKGAGEEMKAKYTYGELEHLLAEYGFYIYEHLDGPAMSRNYFDNYCKTTGQQMKAPEGVEYLLAVRK